MLSGRTVSGATLLVLRLALLAFALAAIVYGVLSGGLQVVLAKGIRVCLECIGIA